MSDATAARHPLRSITLRNFKSVQDATVRLAPLTVLVGANSSGKSSILQALVALHQVASNESPVARFALNGPKSSLGYFSEVRHAGAAEGDPVEIAVDLCVPVLAIGFTTVDWQLYSRLRGAPLPVSYSVTLAQTGAGNEEGASPFISAVTLRAQTAHESAEIKLRRGRQTSRVRIVAGRVASGGFQALDPHRRFDASFTGSLLGAGTRERVSAAAFAGGLPIQLIRKAAGAEVGERFSRIVDQLMIRFEPARSKSSTVRLRKPQRDRVISVIVDALWRWSVSEDPDVSVMRAVMEDLAVNDLFEDAAALFTSHPMELRRAVRDRWSGSKTAYFALESNEAQVIDYASQQLLAFLANHTFYLAGLRVAPQPLYPLTALASDGDIGTRGENLAAVLLTIGDREVSCPTPDGGSELKTLRDGLRDWVRVLGLLDDIQVENRGAHGNALKVRQIGGTTTLDVSAVGVGVSQVLPVLVRCILAEPGQVVLLEQPELHLHPAAQLGLADFLVACVRTGRQIVVETHSEHLVNRLRRRVAEAPTDERLNDQIAIVFAERDRESGATQYRPVELNELGGFDSWPHGFFPEGADEVRSLLHASLRKRAAAATPEQEQGSTGLTAEPEQL
jgi:predicted ATPase